ncbi:CpsD/CapB family tyrosine-protein kinase [Neotabrizicola sp. sgz301269]|uniref:CpsD/CapB family tyrosine-protein kinase n=1 Tax=Neotabrizicola sp. sgz301269 TaxID=3276282 RepID=UPI00376FF430
MNRHIILGAEALDPHDKGQTLMPGKKDDGKGRAETRPRPGHVPVFRQGQVLPAQPITLDQKTGREILPPSLSLATLNPARIWESITLAMPEPGLLARNGLFSEIEHHPAAPAFDILRTRVVQAMARNGWTRLAVTSPTRGCGKSLVAANLALALARLPSCRTVLVDLDLREPDLADRFGLEGIGPLVDYLRGEQPMESHFRRIGSNLALALNGAPVARAAELIQDPEFAMALGAVAELLQPDIVIFDTPPVLPSDEVISLTGQVDAVLLVVDGTQSTAQEIKAAEDLLEGQFPLLGVVMNRAQDRALTRSMPRRRQ